MAFLLAALLFAGPAEKPAAAAMLLRVKGAATVTPAGGKAGRAWATDLLRPGDRLTVPEGGEAQLYFLEDGHREVLAAGKTVTVEAGGCTPAAAVARKEAAKLGKAALGSLRADLRAGRMGGVMLRQGMDDTPPPALSPLPGANVLTARPTLSWPAVAGAEGYVVGLFTGPDTKDLQKVWRLETKENRLPFPKAQPDLQPVAHRWSVTARLPGGGSKEVVSLKQGTFSVATPREARLLEDAKTLAAGDDPADLLLAIGLYESRAVHDEALKVYEKLVKQLPGQAPLHEALARYYDAGGRTDLAKKERARAAELRQAAADK